MSDTQPPPKPKSLMQQFMEFLKTFVISAASSKLITAFVNDLVNPLVGLALPSGSLKELSYSVTNSVTGVTSTFAYGDLIANIIDFVIIAFLVFLMYKILSRSPMFGVEDKTKSK